ncbi:MAG: hypothetical protein ACT443_02785 [Gemmatimonadota bacterium]
MRVIRAKRNALIALISPIALISLIGLEVRYSFSALRTDIPGQAAIFRSLLATGDDNPSWEPNLAPGVYTLVASAGQYSTVHGFAAVGDQVVMNVTVT